MKKDKVYIQHIIKAIDKIETFLRDRDFIAMSNDEMLTSALAYQLSIIGEATNNLSKDFQGKHPEIPFRDIISMRNFLIHKYFGIKRKVIWDTCNNDVKELRTLLLKIINP